MGSSERVLAVLAKKIHGEVAERVVDRLAKVGEATDEQLSQALGIEIATIRRTLNALYESRLAKYRRVRDEERGWYLYYWRLTDEFPSRVLEERKRKALDILRKRLEYEQGSSFFYCPRCRVRYSFDDVVEFMFRCPGCGTDLEAIDNGVVVEKLRQAIELLEKLKFD